MVTILIMSTKLATPSLSFDYDVTNKILSRDSNYIVDVVMKCGNSSISRREAIITSIL